MLTKHHHLSKELLFWVLSVFILVRLIIGLIQPIDTFTFTTWLINYDLGFTKRGLLGAVITNLFDAGNALSAIEIITKLIFVAIFAIYYYIIFRYRTKSHIVLVLLLSPALILFFLTTEGNLNIIGRIEQIGILITIANCFLIRNTLKSHNRLHPSSNGHHLLFKTCLSLILPVFMLSLLMFAHEATLLLSVPSI